MVAQSSQGVLLGHWNHIISFSSTYFCIFMQVTSVHIESNRLCTNYIDDPLPYARYIYMHMLFSYWALSSFWLWELFYYGCATIILGWCKASRGRAFAHSTNSTGEGLTCPLYCLYMLTVNCRFMCVCSIGNCLHCVTLLLSGISCMMAFTARECPGDLF